jgi:hypothetical protein
MEPDKTPLGQAVKQFLQGGKVRIFVPVTLLTRIGNLGISQSVFGQEGYKHVGVGVPRFGAFGDSGHMATDAVGEGVDGMGQVVVNDLVTGQTLLRTGPFGLKLCGRKAQLMDVMAGCAGDAFPGVRGLLPVKILLVVTFGEFVGVDIFKITGGIGGGFIIEPQGTTGQVAHRPFDTLHFCCFAAVVTGTADLCPEGDGEVGGVYDG